MGIKFSQPQICCFSLNAAIRILITIHWMGSKEIVSRGNQYWTTRKLCRLVNVYIWYNNYSQMFTSRNCIKGKLPDTLLLEKTLFPLKIFSQNLTHRHFHDYDVTSFLKQDLDTAQQYTFIVIYAAKWKITIFDSKCPWLPSLCRSYPEGKWDISQKSMGYTWE